MLIVRILKSRFSIYQIVLVLFLIFSAKVSAQDKIYLPKPKQGNTYVVAHRGVHNGIPENTLAAYQKAIDLGCDFVEIDIRKTKDGRFVSVHPKNKRWKICKRS